MKFMILLNVKGANISAPKECLCDDGGQLWC